MTKCWLKAFDWNAVVEINEGLCTPTRALHKASSDGYEKAKTLWEQNYETEIDLYEAVELCRKCHRIGPFCNYNGNTFVAIIRMVINGLPAATDEEKVVARSLSGHIVAGTAEPDETEQFRLLLDSLKNR